MLEPQRRLAQIVYVLVNNPSKVMIGENTEFASEGILRSNLDLYVSPDATANLNATVGSMLFQ
jgi:hypothetical protein